MNKKIVAVVLLIKPIAFFFTTSRVFERNVNFFEQTRLKLALNNLNVIIQEKEIDHS